ncbi:ATP-binding protein [Microbispora sp. RL4-1S]|uniref:ATP-binding protein n=1 Tax=Microbispora oryzae TaxID=2806554 RepID=A0A941AHW8_9ACTN|nr:ATP-binding protein [Microbispora oryzae]MBP2704546.1 ATP-binding protein [Microbispora oryzae]
MVDHHRQWPITDDLATLREHVQTYARRAGLSGARLDDLVIAANEAAINVLEHGGGTGVLAISHDDDALAVEVTDNVGVLQPSALPADRPTARADRGYGLWLMGELCDTVSIEQARGGSLVRLSMRLAGSGVDPDPDPDPGP